MNWSATIGALVIATAPLAAQQPQAPASPTTANGAKIMLHGCVRPGIDKDTVLMTDTTEATSGGQSAIPTEAHGRKVIFWLDKDDALKAHVGRVVEVSGTTNGVQKSEAELKAGHQNEGGLVVEFEGPGKDVKASNADVGAAIGTAGRAASEKNDVPTFLIKVKVDDVKEVGTSCS